MTRLQRGIEFDRSGKTEVPVAADAEPAVARHFFRLDANGGAMEFCIAGAVGPQSVWTMAPDGVLREWPSYWKDGLLVFEAPDFYVVGQPIHWGYDKRLQIGLPMPPDEQERLALGSRKSVIVK